MSREAFTIGPRQTVDYVKHPTLGEGRLVYNNGPAVFIPDTGEVVPIARACVGVGSRDNAAYTVCVLPSDERVEFDTTGRKYGERHARIVTFEGVPGWIVDVPSKSGCIFRFEPDGGEPEMHSCNRIHIGTPAEYKKSHGKHSMALAASKWMSRDKFVYCRECDYVAPTPETPPAVQGDLFGGSNV